MSTFKRDSKGIAQLLKSEGFAKMIRAKAEQIAAATRSQVPSDVEVVVDSYVTDRQAASVTIRDARGRLLEVRDGVLTRAATSQGLEVTQKTDR